MITIVVPAYNEEDAIGQVVSSLRGVMEREGLAGGEVLVVDDGSADATAPRAREAGATVVQHPHNGGYGRALKSGIRQAAHDTVVIIDADLSYPGEAIPGLVEEYRKGFDMVVGARTGGTHRDTGFKGVLRIVLRFLVEYGAERRVPDVNSGLRVFSRATILGYLNHLCDTFSFTTSLTLAYLLTGRFVKYVPVEYHERAGRTKVRLLKDSIRTLQYIFQSMIYYNPLRIFLLMCLVCVFLSVLSFAVGALSRFNAPYYLGVGGLLVALIVFCLGLLADLLRQIMVK